MEHASRPYIEFQQATVHYNDEVIGLRNVSLAIAKGEFVFFCGKTGSGKSTLLKLLTREVLPTRGKVLFEGTSLGDVRDRDVPALRRRMGIVPQDFALLPRKKVWENVAFAMRAVGATRKEARRRAPEILDHVNMGHRIDAYPHELSGGEQQRVAIARALIHNPSLILADEPTGNLDPDHSWEIIEVLARLNREGATVLVASHDMIVVERMQTRIIRLDHGRVIADQPASAEPAVDAEHEAQIPLFEADEAEPATVLVPPIVVGPPERVEPAEPELGGAVGAAPEEPLDEPETNELEPDESLAVSLIVEDPIDPTLFEPLPDEEDGDTRGSTELTRDEILGLAAPAPALAEAPTSGAAPLDPAVKEVVPPSHDGTVTIKLNRPGGGSA